MGARQPPPGKSLYTDRWYQFYEDTYNYTTWMTLLTERNYAVAGYSANWASPISGALSAWNNTPNTVYFSEAGQNPENDVFIAVTGSGAPDPYCFTDFGVRQCIPEPRARVLGLTGLYDQLKHDCGIGDCDGQHTKPNTWWYAMVLLNDTAHTGFYGTADQRKATTAHELGHTISLAHDGIGDFECGLSMPPTVMDYDCNDQWVYGPQPWDTCGVNHAYYDPNWGWSEC